MSRSTVTGVILSVVLILYFTRLSAKSAELERQQGPDILGLVQQQFEPSPKLLAMHPVGDFTWVATSNAVDCKFQRPEIKSCWEVYFGANVEGPDPNGRKPGKVEANFIVDSDAMKIIGGAPPGGIFTRKSRGAAEDRATGNGSGGQGGG